MNAATLLPDVPALAQGGLLLTLLVIMLRVMFLERRDHREELERLRVDHRAELADKRARIKELEDRIRSQEREHEAEIDEERGRRRAAEDAAPRQRMRIAGEVEHDR